MCPGVWTGVGTNCRSNTVSPTAMATILRVADNTASGATNPRTTNAG